MLHDLEKLIGAPVLGTDGEIGRIRNFLFDDKSWLVRHMVINVGSWLQRHDVIVAISAVESADWEKRIFHIRLTREEARNSPNVDATKPVSRQQEIAMEEYFGKLASWVHAQMGGAQIAMGRKFPVRTAEDPDLRSAWDLPGYEVWAIDGKIGRLEGLLLDEASWHLGYLDVKAGGWLHERSVLIPTRCVKSVSWADLRVNLLHTQEEI